VADSRDVLDLAMICCRSNASRRLWITPLPACLKIYEGGGLLAAG